MFNYSNGGIPNIPINMRTPMPGQGYPNQGGGMCYAGPAPFNPDVRQKDIMVLRHKDVSNMALDFENTKVISINFIAGEFIEYTVVDDNRKIEPINVIVSDEFKVKKPYDILVGEGFIWHMSTTPMFNSPSDDAEDVDTIYYIAQPKETNISDTVKATVAHDNNGYDVEITYGVLSNPFSNPWDSGRLSVLRIDDNTVYFRGQQGLGKLMGLIGTTIKTGELKVKANIAGEDETVYDGSYIQIEYDTGLRLMYDRIHDCVTVNVRGKYGIKIYEAMCDIVRVI